MKYKILILSLLVCFCTTCFTACQKQEEQHFCAKCGAIATTTLSGPADIIEKNGISITQCTQITSDIYTAYVCQSCVGLVAELKP